MDKLFKKKDKAPKAEKPLVLHAHAAGPNPYKVAMLLEGLGLPYVVKVWEFGDASNGVKGPAFLKINENGRVPALEDPNTSVTSWESFACVNYLLHTYDTTHKFHPGPTAGTQEHVDMDKWIALLLSTLGPMQGQVNWFKHYNATPNEDALKRYTEQTLRCYGVLEGQLKKTGGKSIIKSGVGAADFHYYPWVAGHEFSGLSLAEYPMVRAWLEMMKERAEVKAAYKKIGEGEKM